MKKIPKKKKRPGIDEYGRNELHYAAGDNDIEAVQKLLDKGVDVNALDDNNFSALHFAVQSNNKEIVKMLIDHGATIDVRDCYGNTPLIKALNSCYAAMANNETDPGAIIRMLLQAGADPNSENNYGVRVIDSAIDCDKDLKQFFES